MVGVAIAGVAFGLFVLSSLIGVGPLTLGTLIGVIALGLAPNLGSKVGHRHPALSRWLFWMWTPAVVTLAAAMAVLLAYAGIEWVAEKDASTGTKLLFALVAAVVAAASTQVGDWLKKRLAPWRTGNLLCSKYRPSFPCLPISLGPGRTAYEKLSDWCYLKNDVSGQSLVVLLEDVRKAFKAGEYHGGPNWECLPVSRTS